jgi:hypothetical protein
MLGTRRCDFMALLAGAAVVSPLLAAQAQESATTGVTATSPQIEIARAKPVDAMPSDLRLSDGRVDLMNDFSLSSRQGVGRAWEIPPYVAPPDAFDERYGEW